MADFSTTTPVPGLTTAYTSVLTIINDKFTDLVKGLDTSPTNLPTNAIAWSSASNKWRKWSGTAWQDLSSLYSINISGNAATATTATNATNASTVTNGVYTVGDQSIGGVKTFTSQLKLSSGTAALPGLTFSADASGDTGFYWSGEGYINFSNNGVYSGYIGPGGAIVTVGNITAYGTTTQPSDIRLKTNILKIEGALDKVDQLTGITYNRTDSQDTSRRVGVIAQEVQKVLPEAIVVMDDEQKTLTVAYGNLVGLLIEAIKELRIEVNTLKQK